MLSEDDWTDAHRFQGDVRDPDSKIPWELATHAAASSVTNLNHVVAMIQGLNRNHIDHDNTSYRIYLEYCDQGDLDNLIERFIFWRKRIPEALIWHVAECLAEAAYAMAYGTLRDGEMPGWEEIVHR